MMRVPFLAQKMHIGESWIMRRSPCDQLLRDGIMEREEEVFDDDTCRL
jgi:hypothetical protein